MALKCPSCGGTIVYNPENCMLECAYCNSQFQIKDYAKTNEAKKTDLNSEGLQVDTYCCNNCGAELYAPEQQIVSYCMYCGGQSTLLEKSQVIERPVRIGPFTKPKKEVKELYKSAISKRPFIPKEFSNPEFLEGFRGIYIPYWKTKVTADTKTADITGTETTYEGKYDVTRTYNCSVSIFGEVDTGTFDASENFDDTIASEISPFQEDMLVPFNEGYLAGFYADKPSVDIDTYQKHIDYIFHLKIADDVKTVTDGLSTNFESLKSEVTYSNVKKESVLYPVWFLTWKKNKRVAYSAMNGQTGALSADIPVDIFKYFKTVFIMAAIIFAILSIFPSFIIPLRIATWSSVFMLLNSIILKKELRKIKQNENHFFDWGFKNTKMKKYIPGKSISSWAEIVFSVFFYIYLAFFAVGIFSINNPKDVLSFFSKICFLQIIVAVQQIMEIVKIQKKSAIFTSILSVLIQIICYAISLQLFAHDYWYYGMSAACLVGMIIISLTCILYINYLTTQPVPDFYTREGANNGK